MLALSFTLFIAGIITILLPCILPLIPIVLGVSVAGRSRWRPLLTVLGMVVSFVGFTLLLHVVLGRFVAVADYVRIGTYYVLFLFGVGFLATVPTQVAMATLGALFFLDKGKFAVLVAALLGIAAVQIAARVVPRLQQLGASAQGAAREEFGQDSPFTAFIIGLTLGVVWVPCAGPALGFVFAIVREQPGFEALFLLLAYALGTAVPLLLVGYGGQWALHSVRALARYSGRIKHVAGVLLLLSALSLRYGWLLTIETWLVQNTSYGIYGTELEERLFGERLEKERSAASMPSASSMSSSIAGASSMQSSVVVSSSSSSVSMELPALRRITRAPEFAGLTSWLNSAPLTLADLKGKVVLVDFWTYSCINCIRTLPYIQSYWEKYKNRPFVLVGVHTPEFAFEELPENVAAAVKRHGLTYPVAQDNDYGTWDAFANRYWPAKYLIDAEGYIRYTHFGEGACDETDKAIQSLLKEIGALDAPMPVQEDERQGRRQPQTAETYLGERSWPALQNAQGKPGDDIVTYAAPEGLLTNRYALVGDWQLLGGERQVLRSDKGEIRMKFLGAEINLVLGLEAGAKAGEAEVWIDGARVKNFTVDRDDLYVLWTGEYGEHELTLKLSGKGIEGYAFTFGS